MLPSSSSNSAQPRAAGPARGIIMGYAQNIGRIGGLAVALGIGVGLVATPWAASAKPGNGQGNGQNMSISKDGDVKVQKGTAQASTTQGEGSAAKAKGEYSTADARDCTNCTAIATGDDVFLTLR